MMNVVSSVAVLCVLDVVAEDDDDTAADDEEEEDDNVDVMVEASPPRTTVVTTAALLTCDARSLSTTPLALVSTSYPCACTFDSLRLLR